MNIARWALCKLGQHEGDISCDVQARTVSFQCRYCPYRLTDPIAPGVLREMGL